MNRRTSGSKGVKHYHDNETEYVIMRRRKGFLRFLYQRNKKYYWLK